MLTYVQSIILGLVQGMTELFPVSSLGHSVILPSIFGWHIDQQSDYFLDFLVATHAATALVLFFFFFKEWAHIVGGGIMSLKRRHIDPARPYEKIFWLIVIGTIPAGLLGLLFQEKLQMLFASPRLVAIVLILNGIMLAGAERLKKRMPVQTISTENMSRVQALKIGVAQALALIPGFSRTGATLSGGLLTGLGYADAARFSFLLATPIIFAAAVLKLPHLFISSIHGGIAYIGPILAGAAVAAVAAYCSVRFLTKYFSTKTLWPFALYCVLAGAAAFLFLL